MLDAARCWECRRELAGTRMTVPRPISGDLVFCGWRCQESWRTGDVKLSPVQRLDLEDAVISLAGRAATLGYPVQRIPMNIRELAKYDNDDLSDRYLRLKAWVADREAEAEKQR